MAPARPSDPDLPHPARPRDRATPATPATRARACLAARGARALKKSHPVLFPAKADAFAFIHMQRPAYSLTRLCALYGVTRAGYYAWCRRPMCAGREQDRQLLEHIRVIFAAHDGKYGSPRVYREALTGPGENAHMESFFIRSKRNSCMEPALRLKRSCAPSCGAIFTTTTTSAATPRSAIAHPLTTKQLRRRTETTMNRCQRNRGKIPAHTLEVGTTVLRELCLYTMRRSSCADR